MHGLLLRLGAFIAAFVLAGITTSITNRVFLRFDNVAVGSVVISPDGRGGFSSFRSRDGVDLFVEHFDFPSHESANAAFQDMLRGAQRTVEREVLYDREGKRITGERMVIIFRAESGVDAAAVISLDDATVYRIASTSLRHTLLFEQTHRRY